MESPALALKPAGNYRWVICALLFFAATVNYVDRQVIGLLKPTLQEQFGWSELDYGNIVKSFQLAYMFGMALSGLLMDRLGTRIGFSIAVIVWSVAAMLHAEATAIGAPLVGIFAGFGLAWTPSVIGFAVCRFLLGLGEAGNFPASVKTVAEWLGPPLLAIYLIADIGSVAGGWLSSTFIKRGWSINAARKVTMLICAISVTPIVFVSQVSNMWVAVLLVGLAAASHQAWSANIYTIASDMFPKQASVR